VASVTASVELSAADVDHYRRSFRCWLETHGSELAANPASHDQHIAEGLALSRTLWEAGWKRFGWPESLGGFGGGPRHRATYYDELCRAGLELPDTDLSIEVIAPALLRYAPALAETYLPRFLAGEEAWAQAFSEPDAGSDLAALRTRGVLEGDQIVVDGQKVWTSHGHLATRLVILVRTGTPESRHRGLAALLVDTDTPGLIRRPLTFASGVQEMCETFLQGVRAPADRVIGGVTDGWGVAMYMLQYERSMYAAQRQAFLGLRLLQIRQFLEEHGAGESAGPALRAAWLLVQTVRARSIQTVRRLDAGETVGPEASADKILLARAEQAVFELARLAGRGHFVWDAAGEPWRHGWWYSRATSIFGGAGEIQRSIVADRILRLPSE